MITPDNLYLMIFGAVLSSVGWFIRRDITNLVKEVAELRKELASLEKKNIRTAIITEGLSGLSRDMRNLEHRQDELTISYESAMNSVNACLHEFEERLKELRSG